MCLLMAELENAPTRNAVNEFKTPDFKMMAERLDGLAQKMFDQDGIQSQKKRPMYPHTLLQLPKRIAIGVSTYKQKIGGIKFMQNSVIRFPTREL